MKLVSYCYQCKKVYLLSLPCVELAYLAKQNIPVRKSRQKITVFKSVGTTLSDLFTHFVYQKIN